MDPVVVTPETYIRAESDRNFRNFAGLTGGVNRFFHIRTPTPLDKQTVIRMNQDTLYSAVVVDTAKGATITLPEVADRAVHVRAGRRQRPLLPGDLLRAGPHPIESDTRYAVVIVRIQVFDPRDPAEVALVNALQDRLASRPAARNRCPPSNWEPKSLQALTTGIRARRRP